MHNITAQEAALPHIIFSLKKAGVIDENFTFEFKNIYGPWSDSHPYVNPIDTSLANAMAAVHNRKRQQGYFTTPFLVRYVLVGHDGHRLFASHPVMMTGCFAAARRITDITRVCDSIYLDIKIIHGPYFSLVMHVDTHQGLWTDAIKCIEIYVSRQSDPYISDNFPDTEPDASSFYRVASIDGLLLFNGNSGFITIHVPITSSYIPDLEGNKFLDDPPEIIEHQEIKDNHEIEESSTPIPIHPGSLPSMKIFYWQPASASLISHCTSDCFFPSLHPFPGLFSGLSPPSFTTPV